MDIGKSAEHFRGQKDMSEKTEFLKKALSRTKQEVAKVIIGQEAVVDKALIAIFSGNHALIEGVPGVAKTLLVRTLAHVMRCDFARIQFTPDLMPTDITGTHVFNLQKDAFSLVKGPVFTTFLLADEINRAPAKTQSALLQAMQERTVTIDRKTHKLSPNFTVFATQNPIEYEGTYPLPEAQKDRFMLKISMDHPGRDEELSLARRMLGKEAPEEVLVSGQVKQIISLVLGISFIVTIGGNPF
jgi:MoxR-like ATPase